MVSLRFVACLMTPSLSKDIQCHTHFLYLQITRSDNVPHVKWAVSLVITDDHLIFRNGLCEYVWVNTLTSSSQIVESYSECLIQFSTSKTPKTDNPKQMSNFGFIRPEKAITLEVCTRLEILMQYWDILRLSERGGWPNGLKFWSAHYSYDGNNAVLLMATHYLSR